MFIEIENISNIGLSKEQSDIITNVIEKTIEHEKFPISAEVSVTITNDEKIQQINKEHRNIDAPTDVLSFPMIDFSKGEAPPLSGEYILGDIIISIETAIKQSKEYNHSLQRELGFLTAHSMLHLMGYDHMNDESEMAMCSKQEEILSSLRLFR